MQTTHLSLIARLQDPRDAEAWQQFVCIYQPAIIRSLEFKGLQLADAEDTAQQVLVNIAKALSKRPHDPSRARFRTWLETVIRNAAINTLRQVARRKDHEANAGEAIAVSLESVAQGTLEEETLDIEVRRQIFHIAAAKIQGEFDEATWQAFWRTTVLHESIESVAKDLGKQRGSVYAARSRIIKRLRREVEKLEQDFGSKLPSN